MCIANFVERKAIIKREIFNYIQFIDEESLSISNTSKEYINESLQNLNSFPVYDSLLISKDLKKSRE